MLIHITLNTRKKPRRRLPLFTELTIKLNLKDCCKARKKYKLAQKYPCSITFSNIILLIYSPDT